MAITDRTRKILWVKAGGRCSICQVQIATDATDSDDPSVFGEEAHIVGQSPKGPRAGSVKDVDSYANLILLCRKHHKQVDDQVGYYTVERLKEIKRQHEEWIASLGEQDNDPGPVRLIPDPAHPLAKRLKLIITGAELWSFIDGSCSFYPSRPSGLNDEQEDVIAAFFDNMRDWMDFSGELSFSEQRQASHSLDENIMELAKAGLVIGARYRHLLLTGGVPKRPQPWRAIDLEVQPFSLLIQLQHKDGQPVDMEKLAERVADFVRESGV